MVNRLERIQSKSESRHSRQTKSNPPMRFSDPPRTGLGEYSKEMVQQEIKS